MYTKKQKCWIVTLAYLFYQIEKKVKFYLEKEKLAMSQLEIMIPIGVALLIGFAYLVMVWIDIPLREYLKTKMVDNLKK